MHRGTANDGVMGKQRRVLQHKSSPRTIALVEPLADRLRLLCGMVVVGTRHRQELSCREVGDRVEFDGVRCLGAKTGRVSIGN